MIKNNRSVEPNRPTVTIDIRTESGTPVTRIAWHRFWLKLIAKADIADVLRQSPCGGATAENDERDRPMSMTD